MWRLKKKEYEDRNDKRVEILRKKGRDIVEMDNEVFREHYINDLKDLKAR